MQNLPFYCKNLIITIHECALGPLLFLLVARPLLIYFHYLLLDGVLRLDLALRNHYVVHTLANDSILFLGVKPHQVWKATEVWHLFVIALS